MAIDMNQVPDLNGVAEIRDWVTANYLKKSEAEEMMASKIQISFGPDFEGQTYTITGGASETYTGVVPASLIVTQTIKTLNTTYLVSCDDSEGTAYTREIVIGPYYGVYPGEVFTFRAYIECTADAGAVVTATNGVKTYTGTADNRGYLMLTIGAAGTYSLTATLNGETTSAVTVEVTTVDEIYTCKLPSLLLNIVSWADGTDDEIAAMIDAARAGTIDLQTDGGWAVGDVRTIKISAFSAESTTSYAEQSIDIAISSFEDYNECGCIMQFDFCTLLTASHTDSDYKGTRMNSSNTNSGGYGATEMYKTTLPALVEALPSWLKERLIEFSVLASAGSQSSTINTVTGNLLALRSEVEIFGKTTYSKSGEGSQIPYYTTSANRIKKRDGAAGGWWERSPRGGTGTYFCSVTSDGSAYYGSASGTSGVAPFGCL